MRRSAIKFVAFICLFVCLVAAPATAAPGDLDSSFDGDGRVTTDVLASDSAEAVVVQADGKVIAVGGFLARYDSSGTLDPTFDDDGISNLGGSDVALQDDGKIVVVFGNKVARLNIDGTPDMSFGGDGVASTPVLDGLGGVAIQADGKIVGVGSARFQMGEGRTTVRAGIVRWNGDGARDMSFSDNGITLFRAGRSCSAEELAIQPNGKIVIVGMAATPRGDEFALFRVLTNGARDASFGDEGVVKTRFGIDDHAVDVELQADGKIVAAGFSTVGGETNRQQFKKKDFALARYTKSGQLDETFSHDGKRLTDFVGGRDQAGGLAIQANGRILLSGIATNANRPGIGRFALARYRRSGALDSTFSGNGKQQTRFGPSDRDYGWDVAVQPDGRIVVVGAVTVDDSRFAFDVGLARYLP